MGGEQDDVLLRTGTATESFFPVRQWVEVPNTAISPTIISHKLYGSGVKERDYRMCLSSLILLFSLFLFD